MNDRMWEHPATRANVALLRERGVEVLEPGTGRLATHGEWGAGRLPEPAALLAAVEARLRPRTLGRACARSSPPAARASRSTPCAISATAPRGGWGSRSPTPPRRAARRSSSSRPTSRCAARRGVRYVDVATAAELAAACEREFAQADVLVMCAAVADFTARPRPPRARSRATAPARRSSSSRPPTCSPGSPPRRRDGQTLVGFAAEHGDGALERAREKLERKARRRDRLQRRLAARASASTPSATR